MEKKLKQCEWCKTKKTNLISTYISSPLIPDLEEKILKSIEIYGPEWWVELKKIDNNLADELISYDQLTCTVIKGRVCKDCLIKDDKNYKKYRPITKKGNDPFDMMKIVSDDKVDAIDGCSEWFKDIKMKQNNTLKSINLKQ
jgi:hypothetical protein